MIITARTYSDLIKLAKELEYENANIWVKTIPSDLSKINESQLLFSKIHDMGLSIDFLINNAGIGKFCEF